MVKCPNCGEEENLVILDLIDVLDFQDEDNEYVYYIGLYLFKCDVCGKVFEAEADYREKK